MRDEGHAGMQAHAGWGWGLGPGVRVSTSR
jgi:hypothetical protein